jgi:DNA-binding NtrC family response regulator
LKKKSILIVDDEKLILKSLEINLSREGFEVSTASTVNKALTIMQSKQFDIVLTDYLIDNATGLELIKQAKDLQPDTRIILFSGQKDYLDLEETAIPDVDIFISKPFDLKTLLENIAALRR